MKEGRYAEACEKMQEARRVVYLTPPHDSVGVAVGPPESWDTHTLVFFFSFGFAPYALKKSFKRGK